MDRFSGFSLSAAMPLDVFASDSGHVGSSDQDFELCFFDLRQTPGHITTLGALPFPHSRVREECREFISDRFGRLEMIAEHLLELSTHVTTTIEARCCNRVVRVWVCVCVCVCDCVASRVLWGSATTSLP